MKPPKERKWRVVSSEYIAREGDWFTVRRECVELPNGNRVPKWYVFEFPDWVNVIARTRDGRFVFESQYRHGLGRTSYELCAGVIDPTDASPLDAAKRELREETGYGGGEWRHFMTLSPNPTNHNNLSHTFVADGVELLDEQHAEPSEDIEVHLLTPAEVRGLLDAGEIVQALHAAPLWRYLAEQQ